MPRVMINGVIWCKSEDEILKTAVKKLGKNKWDLIASLLSGKTDKQCKERWDTGLDPNIKNFQWSRHEQDVKLRTDNEKIASDSKSVNLKEIEENDLQTLPQARARLANTQNKKNKRFTREKQIAVIRRLKHHQRMIEKKRSERNRIFNYNSENSIENQTDSYFYDSSTKENFSTFFEGFSKDKNENLKRSRESDIAIDSIDSNEKLIKRSKVLVVPVPQYSYYNLHAFHDSQCKPGFDFISNYPILQKCDV